MSRRDEFKQENPNPATRFLEWKSEKKCFEFYNKDTEKREDVQLPFRFLVLKEMHTVKGWNDASESAIYSNEVKFIGSEEVTVRSFKGGEIAKGLYKDIRTKIQDAGGHYVKSLYIMTEENEVWNIQLKGSAVSEWSEFTKKSRSRLFYEWVLIESADERKKGAVNYTVPIFQYNTSLSEEEGKKADEVYAVVETYMNAYLDANKIKEITPLDNVPTPAPAEAFADDDNWEKDNPFV